METIPSYWMDLVHLLRMVDMKCNYDSTIPKVLSWYWLVEMAHVVLGLSEDYHTDVTSGKGFLNWRIRHETEPGFRASDQRWPFFSIMTQCPILLLPNPRNQTRKQVETQPGKQPATTASHHAKNSKFWRVIAFNTDALHTTCVCELEWDGRNALYVSHAWVVLG